MNAEIGIAAILAATGFVVLLFIPRDLGGAVLVWLSVPVGTGIYLIAALVMLISTGTLTPAVALTVTGAVGAVGAIVGGVTRRWDPGAMLWAVVTLAVVVATVILARTLHLTRLTPDSMRYLLFSTDLRLPNAVSEIHSADLLNRQMGLPSLHALSSLTDRRYLASIGPLFGVSGLGFFVWLTWRSTRDLAARRRWMLVVTAALFLGTSNRLVYDAFYINTHIEVAVFLLIAIAGTWLAMTTEGWVWALPAGLALGVTPLFRAEAPLVAAIILVAVGASRSSWPVRMAMTLPTLVVVALWYGVVLWQNASGGNTTSITAPVFGSLLAVSGGALVVVAGGFRRLSSVVRYSDRILLAGLLVALVGLGLANLDILTASVDATFQNLVLGRGTWLLTWTAAVVLVVVALMVHQVPHGRLWTTPIVGFGLMFWLLPVLRDGPWRVGAGDSGNRILAHILAVVVAFLVLAAVESWRSVDTDVSEPIR